MTPTPESPLYSHHIFTFPFQWDHLPKGNTLGDVSFSNRTKLDFVEETLQTTEKWKASPFEITEDIQDQYHTFNEYNYFHGYVRDALAISLNESHTTKRFSYHLQESANASYIIELKGRDQPYTLLIKEIILTIYDVGVGYLAFFLENYESDNPIDILQINDFGRRIYPQFLAFKQQDASGNFSRVDAPKYSFLADRILLTGVFEKGIGEDFSYYDEVKSLNGEPFRLPSYIQALLGNQFVVGTRESKQQLQRDSILLSPLFDDRMFAQCYYFLPPSEMEALRVYQNDYAYIESDFWYSYVFVDPSLKPACQSRKMKPALLATHTYDRWIDNKNDMGISEGQLFGVSRYSFMTVVDRCFFTEQIMINHHRYLYFQMVALALTQRAAILRFSAEVANISEQIKGKVNAKRVKNAIQEVHQAYLYFTNKIYFREITPQEQGIELYDLLRKSMEIDTDLKALQQEIAELHQYAVLLENEESNKQAERLTWVATFFLPPALVAGAFGFSNFPADYPLGQSYIIAAIVSIILVALILLSIIAVRFIRR